MREIILKHALKNAVEHGGKAKAAAVMNKVLGEKKVAAEDIAGLKRQINGIVQEVNKMKIELQRSELLRIWPAALEKKKPEKKEMPELPNATAGKVVVRIAPNTNGPMHIGHSRGIVINNYYAKKYNGKFILKIDDTDPETKAPMLEAYEWHVRDTEWLTGRKPEIVIASERLEKYYEHAKRLIELGGAYACSCSAEESHKNRAVGKACKHREQPVEKNLEEWKKMLAGKYKRGEMVLKVETDLSHPNPAIRDWVAFRISFVEHPRAGKKYCVWPLMDFANAIDDHLLGMTHVIRGKELRMSTERQGYIYKKFGWKYPETLYWGRVKIHRGGQVIKISKSGFKKGIEEGKYRGWDDPRLPTLMGLQAAGFLPEAIEAFWLQIGLSERDISASFEILEKINERFKRARFPK